MYTPGISTPLSSSSHSAEAASSCSSDMDQGFFNQSTTPQTKLPVPSKQLSVTDADTEFVENSLRLYEHGSFIVKSLFNNHPSFERALKDGINHFVNRDSTSIISYPTASIETTEERIDGQYSVRRMIRRHRKRMTGSSKQIGSKYGKFSIGMMDEDDLEEVCSDSEDCSDVCGYSRSDSSESAARPSKIARRVSWAASAAQITKEGQGLAGASDTNCASFIKAAASSSSSSVALLSQPSLSTPSPSVAPSSSSAHTAAASQVAMLAAYFDKLLKVSYAADVSSYLTYDIELPQRLSITKICNSIDIWLASMSI